MIVKFCQAVIRSNVVGLAIEFELTFYHNELLQGPEVCCRGLNFYLASSTEIVYAACLMD